MCHIPSEEFKEVGTKWLKVYKVAVESTVNDFYFNDSTLGFKTAGPCAWQQLHLPRSFNHREYHTLFTGSEIRLNTLMSDDLAYAYAYEDGEDIGPGYYHFFKTKEEAQEFLERIVGRCNFQKDSRPCILVGEIPSCEKYNEGIFVFEGITFGSIIAKKVYYSGEMYYEGE